VTEVVIQAMCFYWQWKHMAWITTSVTC